MKRINIINQPTSTDYLDDLDFDNYTNAGQLKAERIETKRLRKFRQQLA